MIQAIGILIVILGWKYFLLFKEKQANEISVFVALMDLAVTVFLVEQLKSILSINLLLVMFFIFALYKVIRAIMQVENTQVRKGILECAGVMVGSIAVVALMVRFIDPLVIIVILIGLFLVASGN